MTTEAIVRREETAIQQIDVGALLRQIVEAGVTADAAGAVKELVLLAEHRADRDAKQQWLTAFSRVRAQMKTINAVKGIPAKLKDKQLVADIKWFYAPLEDLQDAVEPILEIENMTMRFDSRRDGNICTGVCIISHIGGHEERAECAVNVAGAEGADLGAMKKAKRGAMTAILGIKTRHLGEGAEMLGDYISQDQADALQRRAEALGDEMSERFKRYVQKTGADDYSKIRQGKYASMDEALTKAEKKILNPTGRVSVPTGASPQPAGAVSGSTAISPATAAAPVPEQATGEAVASGLEAETKSTAVAASPSEKSKLGTGEGPTLAGPSPKAAKCPNPKCKATLAPDGVCPNCGPAQPATEAAQTGPYDHWLTMTPEEVKITWIACDRKKIEKEWKLMPQAVKDRIKQFTKG